MEIFLIILVLIVVGINIFLLYKNMELKKKTKEVKKEPQLTKEEREKQKKIKESFDNLMNYDETIARRRK